jgi:hypothetical protein
VQSLAHAGDTVAAVIVSLAQILRNFLVASALDG